MPYPFNTATTNAVARLGNFYNGTDYNATTNAGGLANNGHRVNFEPLLQDVATVVDSVSDAATAALAAADSATASATTANAAATSFIGTSTSAVSIGTASKTFS